MDIGAPNKRVGLMTIWGFAKSKSKVDRFGDHGNFLMIE